MKVVLILSGGMDSAVLLAQLKEQNHDVYTLTFDYGSKHNRIENVAAERLAEYYGVPNNLVHLPLSNLFVSNLLNGQGDIPHGHYEDASMRSTVVPFRNGIMLSIAVGYAESIGAEYVYFGAHAGDHAIYPDCRPSFTSAFDAAARRGTYNNVAVSAPFYDKTKADIASLGAKLGVPFELTYSCYEGHEEHCGECGTCVERKEAFVLAGVADPTRYKE